MESFNDIHSLLRQKKYSKAMNMIFDIQENRLKRTYSSDKSDRNHAWYIVGDILYKKRQYEQALRAFLNALRAWNEDAETLCAIGNCYSELGRPLAAEKYFKKSLLHASRRFRPSIIYNLGNAFFDQGKYMEAIKLYKRIRPSAKIYSLAQKNIKAAIKNQGKSQ